MNKFTSFLAVVFFISAGVNAAEKMESVSYPSRRME